MFGPDADAKTINENQVQLKTKKIFMAIVSGSSPGVEANLLLTLDWLGRIP